MSEIRRAFVVSCLLLAVAYAANAQQRPVKPFTKLHVQDSIDVVLTQSDRESLRVKARHAANILTEFRNGELRISRKTSRGRFLLHGGGTVYLNVVRLAAIGVSGGSDIRSWKQLKLDGLSVTASGGSEVTLLNVQAKRVDLTLSGGSDAKLRGRADSLAIKALRGGGDTYADGLQTRRAVLYLIGRSHAMVNVTEAIDVNAIGGSRVFVDGNPRHRTVKQDRPSHVYWQPIRGPFVH